MKNTKNEHYKSIIRDEELLELLRAKAEYLEEVLTQKNKALKSAPEGKLHVIRHGKHAQFYLRDSSNNKMGKYIKKAESSLIKKYAQKKYDQKAVKIITGQLKQLRALILQLENQSLSDLFSGLQADEKAYIHPLCMSDEDYLMRWWKKGYASLSFQEDAPVFTTQNGERVRSKSEIIIANALADLHVPYMYEYPLKLAGSFTVHPDFTVLNLRTRKTMYWEHLGMMDHNEYVETAIRKINSYMKSGFYPGTNLILTAETGSQPLNTEYLYATIRHYCC